MAGEFSINEKFQELHNNVREFGAGTGRLKAGRTIFKAKNKAILSEAMANGFELVTAAVLLAVAATLVTSMYITCTPTMIERTSAVIVADIKNKDVDNTINYILSPFDEKIDEENLESLNYSGEEITVGTMDGDPDELTFTGLAEKTTYSLVFFVKDEGGKSVFLSSYSFTTGPVENPINPDDGSDIGKEPIASKAPTQSPSPSPSPSVSPSPSPSPSVSPSPSPSPSVRPKPSPSPSPTPIPDEPIATPSVPSGITPAIVEPLNTDSTMKAFVMNYSFNMNGLKPVSIAVTTLGTGRTTTTNNYVIEDDGSGVASAQETVADAYAGGGVQTFATLTYLDANGSQKTIVGPAKSLEWGSMSQTLEITLTAKNNSTYIDMTVKVPSIVHGSGQVKITGYTVLSADEKVLYTHTETGQTTGSSYTSTATINPGMIGEDVGIMVLLQGEFYVNGRLADKFYANGNASTAVQPQGEPFSITAGLPSSKTAEGVTFEVAGIGTQQDGPYSQAGLEAVFEGQTVYISVHITGTPTANMQVAPLTFSGVDGVSPVDVDPVPNNEFPNDGVAVDRNMVLSFAMPAKSFAGSDLTMDDLIVKYKYGVTNMFAANDLTMDSIYIKTADGGLLAEEYFAVGDTVTVQMTFTTTDKNIGTDVRWACKLVCSDSGGNEITLVDRTDVYYNNGGDNPFTNIVTVTFTAAKANSALDIHPVLGGAFA